MYEFTQLFLYKPLFMAELLVAEWIFTFRQKRRSHYILRLILAAVFCMGISLAIPILDYGPVYSLFMFFGMFAVSVAAMLFVYDISVTAVLFCGIAAYTAQHISHQVYGLIAAAVEFEGTPAGLYGQGDQGMFTSPAEEMTYFTCYCVVYWLMFLIFANRLKKDEDVHVRSFPLFLLLFFIIMIDIVVNSVVTWYSASHYDKVYTILLCICNICCCFSAKLFQFELLTNTELRDENAVIARLWAEAQEQYESSKENIELINVKVHDMKHQISRLSIAGDTKEEIGRLISVYDSSVETGNNVLDVILTEKSLFCSENGIRFSCVADAKKLQFIPEGELYSLFGNIIDNAIEAVLKVEPDKRTISLSVVCVHDFIRINVTNYFENDLHFRDGVPVTTKEGRFNHGYGIKSCRMIVDKYGGDLTIHAEDNIFSLDILLPVRS